MNHGCQREFHLNDFHRANAARQEEAFAPPHPLTALVVCVQEEVGELAAAVLGVTGEKKRKAHLTNDDVLDAVADAITYLSLVASAVGCDDLETLLGKTFNMVSARAGSKITVGHSKSTSTVEPEGYEFCQRDEAEIDPATGIRKSMAVGAGPVMFLRRKLPQPLNRDTNKGGVALKGTSNG